MQSWKFACLNGKPEEEDGERPYSLGTVRFGMLNRVSLDAVRYRAG